MQGSAIDRRRSPGRRADPIRILFAVLSVIACLLVLAMYGGREWWQAAPGLLLALIAAVGWWIRSLVKPGRDVPVPGFVWAAFIYLGWLAWHTQRISPVPDAAWNQVEQGLSVCLVFLMMLMAGGHARLWRWLNVVMLVGGSFLAWLALVQAGQAGAAWAWLPEVKGQWEGRYGGPFMNPNHLGQLLGLQLVASVGLLLHPRSGALSRVVAVYSLLVSVPALLFTHSRSALLATLAGLMVLALSLLLVSQSRRGRILGGLSLLLPVVLLGGAFFLSPQIRERNQSVRFETRGYIWEDTGRMIADAPWVGHGAGAYRWMYPEYADRYRFPTAYVNHAHNEWLHVLAETGAIGLGLLLLGSAFFLGSQVRGMWRLREDRAGYLMTATALGLFAVVLVQSTVDFPLRLAGISLAVAVYAGLFLGGRTAGGGVPKPAAAHVRRKAAFLLVLTLWMTWRLIHSGTAAWYTRHGEQLRGVEHHDRALRSFRRALWWNPDAGRPARLWGDRQRERAVWTLDAEVRLNRREDALVQYDRALAANPNDPFALWGKGRVLRQLGRLQEAADLLAPAMERLPFETLLRKEMVLVHLARNEKEAAWGHLLWLHNHLKDDAWVNQRLEALTRERKARRQGLDP